MADHRDTTAELAVGSRVRLKSARADWWLLPERRFAKEGRLATVICVPNPKYGLCHYSIEFDVKRAGSRPVRTQTSLSDLEVVTNAD